MDTTLTATARVGGGKKIARKLRAAGQVPAVIYGDGDAATAVSVDPAALVHMFRETENRNTIITLDVDGEKTPCLVREVQRHPLHRDILHIDFYKLSAGKSVKVMVPVSTTGKAKGAVLGGRIRLVRRELPISCSWENIPESISIDVSPLDIGDMIRAAEVTLPEGITLRVEDHLTVVSCYGRRAPAAKK
jgi:large subunit ribosomal protein L25